MNSRPDLTPKGKLPVRPQLGQDLYPSVSSYKFSPKVERTMRQAGLNPTQELQVFDRAHAAGDYDTKARQLNKFALLQDKIQGGTATTNWLDSQRLQTQEEATPTYGSVSVGQAFFGSIKNGLTDAVEAVPQLLVAGAGLSHAIDKQQWDKSHAGIEQYFSGLKTYVSQDYTKPLVSYDSDTGFDTNLDFKSLVGTTGNLMSYILPGLLMAGAGTLATIGTRAAVRGAATAAVRAEAVQALSGAARAVKVGTGVTSFLQTFPLYQREALASGLDIHDATLYALPVAAINAVIETANVGPLAKAMGLSENAAKLAIREASVHEATDALLKLGKDFTPDMLIETGRSAAKNALGVISRPQEIGAFGKLLTGVGGRLKRGFLEQGLAEGGEEFTQSLVENASKDLYNNIAGTDSTGRFQNKTFGEYAFDSLYGTVLGAVVGTVPGTFFNTRAADPTVYGYVGANVRDGLRKGYALEDMLSTDANNPARLKMLGVLDHKLQQGQQGSEDGIDEQTHADMVGKVSRMAGIARDFADVDTFTESDRNTMYTVSEGRHQLGLTDQSIAQSKAQLSQVNQAIADPNLSMGEKIRAEIERGKLAKTLGGLVDNGQGTQVYAAELRQQQRTQQVNNVVEQAMGQYADDAARPAINKFVSDNLAAASREYGPVAYDDDFKPTKVLTDPNSGKTFVTDRSKLVFRGLQQAGGQVVQPASINEQGQYLPSVREPLSENYGVPVDNLDTHLALASAVADPANPLDTQDYRRPDNSVEAGWIRDGQQLVTDLQTIEGSKAKGKKKELANTQALAAAYLNTSGFLSGDARYAGVYAEIQAALTPMVAGSTAVQTEENAQTVGGDTDLMDGGIPLSETNPELSFDGQDPFVDPLTNETTDQTQATEPARLAGNRSAAPAEYDEYVANIQRADEQGERKRQGEELSQGFDAALDAIAAAADNAERTVERAGAILAAANDAFESELTANEVPATGRPADTGVSGPESTAGSGPVSGQESGTDGRTSEPEVKRTLKQTFLGLSAEEQAQAVQYAQDYLDIEHSPGLSEIQRRILNRPPLLKNLRKALTRIQGNGAWHTIMQTQYGAKKNDTSASTLDQYAQELSDENGGITVTEQDVVDFIVQYPMGIDSAIAFIRRPIRDAFRTLTGKDINRLSAADVVQWSTDVQAKSTQGIENTSDEDVRQAEILVDNLEEGDSEYLGHLIDAYKTEYGDGWLEALHTDDRAGVIFAGVPESFSSALRNAVANSNFGENQNHLQYVSEYLRQQFPRPYTPLTEYAAGDDSSPGNSDSVGPEESKPTIERPTPDTLAGAADTLRSEENPEPGVAEQLVNEVDQQIAQYAASDTRTADVTAPFDIERADSIQREKSARTRIDNRNRELAKRTTTGDLFAGNTPVAAEFNPQGKPTLFARVSDVPGGFSVDSLKPGETPGRAAVYEILPVSDTQAEYRVNPNPAASELAVSDPYSYLDAAPGYKNPQPGDQFVTVKNGQLVKQGDQWIITDKAEVRNVQPSDIPARTQANLFENETSGLDAQEAVKKANTDDQAIIAAERQRQADIEARKLQAIEQAVEAPVQPTLFEQPQTMAQFQLDDQVASEIRQVLTPVLALAKRLSSAFGVDLVTSSAEVQAAFDEIAQANPTLQGRHAKGFYYKSKVYLNPGIATVNTVLEELGHVWIAATKTTNPKLYERGLALVRDTGYRKSLKNHGYYGSLSTAEQEDEALAQAIANRGENFVTATRKNSFLQWLNELWSSIKKKLGIDSSVDLNKMNLDDFVKLAVEQIQSGEVQAGGISTEGARFQLDRNDGVSPLGAPIETSSILGVSTTTLDALRQSAEEYYKNPASYFSEQIDGTNEQGFPAVNPKLWDSSKFTTADKEFIKEIAKQTGWKLTAAKHLEYVREAADGVEAYHPNSYYLGNGKVVRLASHQIASALQSFTTLYNDSSSNRGKVFKVMVDSLSRWINLETLVTWLDDKNRTLKTLITDVRRDTQRRADYVDNNLQPLLEDLRTKMAPFTAGWQGVDSVPRLTLQSYQVQNGTIYQHPIDIPVAEAMAFVRQVETQRSSRYQTQTGVWSSEPTISQLVRQNNDGTQTAIPKGMVYYDEQADKTHFINIDQAQYEKLRDRFINGEGLTGEAEAYQAIVKLFNNPVARRMLAEESKLLRPDEEFIGVDDYYPLDTFQATDARMQSRQASKTLDENRRLLQRQGQAGALLLRDPLSTASAYLNALRDVLGSARLVGNLNTLQTQLANDYTGPRKDQILSYLAKVSQDLKDHRSRLAKERAEGGLSNFVNSATRRYTNSVFTGLGIPLKQTATYASAYGQSIIKDEFLRSSNALQTLARLTAGAYKDWEAPADINPETGRGFTGSLTGAKTQDADLLRELLGLDITDDTERETYQQQAATLIARTTYQQSLYTGDVEWKQTGLGNAATKGGQVLKKIDEWMNRYGLSAMRHADAGVILSYWVAAGEQAKAEGLTPNTPEYRSRLADLTEQVVYATNMMGQTSDATALQRTTDWVSRLMSLYSGQQQKTLNLVLSRLSEWAKTGDSADLSKLAHAFGYGVIANALWVSMVSAGASAVMAILSGDEPDDQWAERIGFDLARNISGTVPGLASNAVDYLISQHDTIRGNESFADIPALETFKQGLDAINGATNYLLEEDEAKRNKALDSSIYNVTEWAAKTISVPSPLVRLAREWATVDSDDTK